MTPAFEYFVRNNLVKNWLFFPSSLFLIDNSDGLKKVVTIEFEGQEFYKLKIYHLSTFYVDRIFQPKQELFVKKEDLKNFLKNKNLIYFKEEKINTNYNSYKHPMSKELYDEFFENFINNEKLNKKRKNWLWEQFFSIYISVFWKEKSYIFYNMHEEQRKLVKEYKEKEWEIWLKWEEIFLLNPGEFFLMKEYFSNIN